MMEMRIWHLINHSLKHLSFYLNIEPLFQLFFSEILAFVLFVIHKCLLFLLTPWALLEDLSSNLLLFNLFMTTTISAISETQERV